MVKSVAFSNANHSEGVGEEELEKGGQKLETFGYKICT